MLILRDNRYARIRRNPMCNGMLAGLKSRDAAAAINLLPIIALIGYEAVECDAAYLAAVAGLDSTGLQTGFTWLGRAGMFATPPRRSRTHWNFTASSTLVAPDAHGAFYFPSRIVVSFGWGTLRPAERSTLLVLASIAESQVHQVSDRLDLDEQDWDWLCEQTDVDQYEDLSARAYDAEFVRRVGVFVESGVSLLTGYSRRSTARALIELESRNLIAATRRAADFLFTLPSDAWGPPSSN